MKSIINLPQTSKRKGRNPKLSLFLEENHKTISSIKSPPTTSRIMNQSPILTFPLKIDDNDSNFTSTLFSTSTRFYDPRSLKSNKYLKHIIPYNIIKKISNQDYNNNYKKKRISKSLYNKRILISRTIENKINESQKNKKLKKINILDFGNNLKLYDEIEKKFKEKSILEKRKKQLDEIYFDYDKNNQNQIMNSFSGNSANLLKNKVCFVKGIIDYLYPKLILKRMDFIKELKDKHYKENKTKSNKPVLDNYYFAIKHRNPEQNAAMSKYLYGMDIDIIRPRGYFFEPKKTLINKCRVSKLTNEYDFI